jgi:hypothetical protein
MRAVHVHSSCCYELVSAWLVMSTCCTWYSHAAETTYHCWQLQGKVHRQVIASVEALQGQKNVLRRRLIKGLLRSDAQTGLRTGMSTSFFLFQSALHHTMRMLMPRKVSYTS